ncbi:MAG: hypothetical protein EBQ92_00955 [Proteobacteria bacterium]|nr:hypothetical protein [Pseudomonadota bacterium]
MKIFYSLAILIVLSLGLAPAGVAHDMQGFSSGCPKLKIANSDAQGYQAVVAYEHREAKKLPCHTNCPSGGKLTQKSGCCMNSSGCTSIGFLSCAMGSNLGAVIASPIPSDLMNAYCGVMVSGPRKPPKFS